MTRMFRSLKVIVASQHNRTLHTRTHSHKKTPTVPVQHRPPPSPICALAFVKADHNFTLTHLFVT